MSKVKKEPVDDQETPQETTPETQKTGSAPVHPGPSFQDVMKSARKRWRKENEEKIQVSREVRKTLLDTLKNPSKKS